MKFCSNDKKMRLRHNYGRSLKDGIDTYFGKFVNPPDYVAFPSNEEEIQHLMKVYLYFFIYKCFFIFILLK